MRKIPIPNRDHKPADGLLNSDPAFACDTERGAAGATATHDTRGIGTLDAETLKELLDIGHSLRRERSSIAARRRRLADLGERLAKLECKVKQQKESSR